MALPTIHRPPLSWSVAKARGRIIITTAILVVAITANLLIVLTAVFDGFPLVGALAVLGFPLAFWTGDWCSGLVAWPVIKPPVIETPKATTFWHLSMSPPEAFAAGIDFTRAKRQFVGAGFYQIRA